MEDERGWKKKGVGRRKGEWEKKGDGRRKGMEEERGWKMKGDGRGRGWKKKGDEKLSSSVSTDILSKPVFIKYLTLQLAI